MNEEQRINQLEKVIQKQQEEIDQLKKNSKRRSWWNVWLIWR